FFCLGLFLPFAIAVRVIVLRISIVSVHAHGSIPVKGMVRTPWIIDRNLEMINAQPVALRVSIRKESPLQHLVRGKAYPRNNIRWVECSLFHILEIVFGIPVQFEFSNGDQRKVFLGPYLRQVKRMKAVVLC